MWSFLVQAAQSSTEPASQGRKMLPLEALVDLSLKTCVHIVNLARVPSHDPTVMDTVFRLFTSQI